MISWMWVVPFTIIGLCIGWSVKGHLVEREEDRRDAVRGHEFDLIVKLPPLHGQSTVVSTAMIPPPASEPPPPPPPPSGWPPGD